MKRPASGGPAPSDRVAGTKYSIRSSVAPVGLPFLKERLARAIELGDDKHAELIRRLIDRLLNGEAAR
jgi:hypothetical protein